MFYSHEILTSRKLVATLGAKSNTKKLTRKAILGVNVRKACETIMHPEAPMALRLQSNLLYGVSRVYSQQCGYVLADTQVAQNNMKAMLKVVKDHGLDLEAGRARPDQLILTDDPAFLPDMALPTHDFDLSNFDIHALDVSRRSSQSFLSPHSHSQSVSSAISLPGFNLGVRNSSSGQYELPINNPFAESSAQTHVDIAGNLFDDEVILFQDDDLFELDADGNIRDISAEERERRQTANQGCLGSDSAASGRVRKEHEDALAGRANIPGFEDDFNIIQFGDEEMLLPDAEPFPVMSGALPPNFPRLLVSEEHTPSEELSSVSAEAPAKRRKAKAPKILKKDNTLEHRNADLLHWQHEYAANMAKEIQSRVSNKEKTEAKKNGYIFTYGCGIQGVGNEIGASKLPHPLQMFSGVELMARIIGEQPPSPKAKKGVKRVSEDEDEESRKRSRRSEELGEEVGRGEDESIVVMDEDTGIEVGRDAQEALLDYHSSAMPWNVSASLHSHQRGASSSVQGPGFSSQMGGSARRHPSASPLIGRGSNLPGDLERFNQSQDNAPIMFGRDDEDDDAILRQGASQAPVSDSQTAQEFEFFGPAAAVDTQTAGASQWVQEALDKESNNFLEYVRNTINEKTADELVEEGEKFVTFEELFNPDGNSRIVAAQAFYHVLSLATKEKIWVKQDMGSNEPGLMEAFGEMKIGVMGY